MSPAGAWGDWGRSAIWRATSAVGMAAMAAPFKYTAPPRRGMVRESAFRSVDLPQPFGPMMEVILPAGTATSMGSMMMRSP